MSEEERVSLEQQREQKEAEKAEQEKTETKEETTEVTETTPTVEEIAQKIGWNPDFEGEGAVDAETFIINSRDINNSLSKKVKNMGSEMEEMRKSLQVIAEANKATSQAELQGIQSQIKALEQKKKAAVAEADQEAYNKAEQDIEDLEKQAEVRSKVSDTQPVSPDYIKWAPSNEWYEKNPQMRQWADAFATDNPDFRGLPTSKVLEIVGKKAREYFPEEFGHEKTKTSKQANDSTDTKTTQTKVKKVADPARSGRSKKKNTFDQLSYNQKKIAEQFVNQLKGTKSEMTLDQYAEKYFERFPEEVR